MIVDVDGGPRPPLSAPVPLERAALDALVLGTRDYARRCGFTRALLGISGGIDSALVACIAAEALGPRNVLGVAMPSRHSSPGSVADARASDSTLASATNYPYATIMAKRALIHKKTNQKRTGVGAT